MLGCPTRAKQVTCFSEIEIAGDKVRMSSRVCIELFAGAGGMMLGLEQAGFRTLVASEIHPDPCKTLKRNFPDIPVLQGDASKLTFSD